MTRFILKEDQHIYYLHRKQLFETHAAGSGQASEPQVCEFRMLRTGSAPFWARLEASVAKGAGDAPVCRAVLSDITGRKQAESQSEAALKESEDKYSKAFQTAPYAITITRPESRTLVEVNDAFISMPGYSRAEAAEGSSISLKLWVDEKNRDEVLSTLGEGREVVTTSRSASRPSKRKQNGQPSGKSH